MTLFSLVQYLIVSSLLFSSLSLSLSHTPSYLGDRPGVAVGGEDQQRLVAHLAVPAGHVAAVGRGGPTPRLLGEGAAAGVRAVRLRGRPVGLGGAGGRAEGAGGGGG